MLSKIKKEFSFLRGNLLVLIISYMLFRVSGGFTTAYYSLYVRELGASPFVIGLISSLASLVVGLMRIPGGYFADTYGRKKIIVIFTFVAGFSYLIFAAAPDWKSIVLATKVLNLSFVYFPALNALEADSIPEDSRGMGYAATQMLPHLTRYRSPLVDCLLHPKIRAHHWCTDCLRDGGSFRACFCAPSIIDGDNYAKGRSTKH